MTSERYAYGHPGRYDPMFDTFPSQAGPGPSTMDQKGGFYFPNPIPMSVGSSYTNASDRSYAEEMQRMDRMPLGDGMDMGMENGSSNRGGGGDAGGSQGISSPSYINVPFTNSAAFQSTFMPSGWSFDAPWGSISPQQQQQQLQPMPIQNQYTHDQLGYPQTMSQGQYHSPSGSSSYESQSHLSMGLMQRSASGTGRPAEQPRSTPVNAAGISTGDRFSQLLEAKLGLDSSSTFASISITPPDSWTQTPMPQPHSASNPGSENVDMARPPPVVDDIHSWWATNPHDFGHPTQYEARYAQPDPPPGQSRKMDSEVLFTVLDPQEIDSALSDVSQIRIPPDLVAPAIPQELLAWFPSEDATKEFLDLQSQYPFVPKYDYGLPGHPIPFITPSAIQQPPRDFAQRPVDANGVELPTYPPQASTEPQNPPPPSLVNQVPAQSNAWLQTPSFGTPLAQAASRTSSSTPTVSSRTSPIAAVTTPQSDTPAVSAPPPPASESTGHSARGEFAHTYDAMYRTLVRSDNGGNSSLSSTVGSLPPPSRWTSLAPPPSGSTRTSPQTQSNAPSRSQGPYPPAPAFILTPQQGPGAIQLPRPKREVASETVPQLLKLASEGDEKSKSAEPPAAKRRQSSSPKSKGKAKTNKDSDASPGTKKVSGKSKKVSPISEDLPALPQPQPQPQAGAQPQAPDVQRLPQPGPTRPPPPQSSPCQSGPSRSPHPEPGPSQPQRLTQSSPSRPPEHDHRVEIESDSGSAAPKPVVMIACHTCRSRKLKCDGAKPKCYNCTRRKEPECSYDQVLRRRGPGKKPKTGRRAKAGKDGKDGKGAKEDKGDEAVAKAGAPKATGKKAKRTREADPGGSDRESLWSEDHSDGTGAREDGVTARSTSKTKAADARDITATSSRKKRKSEDLHPPSPSRPHPQHQTHLNPHPLAHALPRIEVGDRHNEGRKSMFDSLNAFSYPYPR